MGTYRCYGWLVEREHLDAIDATGASRSVDLSDEWKMVNVILRA